MRRLLLCLHSILGLAFSATVIGMPVENARVAPGVFRTAIVFDDLYLEHDTGPDFPESPDRLRRLTAHLKAHPISDRLLWTQAADTIDPMPWILAVHDAEYVRSLKQACAAGANRMHGSADTPISARTYEVAVGAVAGALTAVDLVVQGKVKNAFGAVRPPGHHAMPGKAKGFCFFSNAAIAARYAQKHHKLERVMIVDWDAHHGDGTQAIFLADPTVFFFSTHQYPFYPGPSGSPDITGEGPGKGFNLNVPLPAGSGNDAVLAAFRTRLTEAFRKFKPQLLIISAGFDAHEDDRLGGLEWSSEVYSELTNILRSLCREQGHERIVSLLEGGYSERGMTEAVRQHIEALEADAVKQ